MKLLIYIVNMFSGANILGLLELLAAVGVWAGLMAVDGPMRWASGAVLSVGALLIATFDLGWRYGESHPTSWRRFISPYTGGCFFYIPVWLLLPLIGLAWIAEWLLR
jgi:hypothetical protein